VAQDGEYLVCPNTATCPAQTVGRIKRYIAGLGVKEWGDTLIERLVEKGLVQTPADLYRLNIPSLGSLERITEPLADNLLGLLWEKIEVPLEVLLGSLSIPLCATSTIRMVMDAGFDTWGKIFSASYEDLQAIPGLGPVKSKALWQWAHGTGEGLMHDMFDVGVKVQPITKGVFTGLSFCFTGKSVRKRSELEGIVTSNGGVVKTSVGKGLSYLVMADPSSGSTKAKAAAQNGTKCISEDDLIRMVG
jgi:DNA ligase (NAD+)